MEIRMTKWHEGQSLTKPKRKRAQKKKKASFLEIQRKFLCGSIE